MATYTERGVGQYVASEGHVLHTHRLGVGPRRICVMHAGRGQQHTISLAPNNGVQSALAERGIASIGADYSNGLTWGNATGVTRAGQVITYAGTRGAPTDKYLLYGTSMGALVLLNWARANPTKVAAFVGLIPALDLVDITTNNRGGYGAEALAAHGGSIAAANNPAAATAGAFPFPIKLWYSTNDPITVPSAVQAFATTHGAELVSMGAIGHATIDKTDEVVEFLDRYG